MESSHGGSVKIFDEPNDNTNLHQLEDIDVITTPCGSCEGCSVIEDCGTRCENCVQNYIQTHIENKTNPNILPCLKRMCHARNLDLKKETLIVRDNSIKDEQEIEPNQNETKINEILIVEKDNTVTIQPMQTGMESKTKSNETVEIKEISRSMEHGETGFKKTIKWDESSSEDNLVFSEGGNDGGEASNVEMCGKCLGCTTDCGDCWTCIQREVVVTKDLTPKMICQKKKCISVKDSFDDEIKKEDDDKVKHHRRKRCGTCPGCVVAENCGNCGPCVRRQKTMIEGRKFKGVCNARKCHALKIRKRCGECEGCQSQSCGKCSVCVGVNKNLCPLRRCHKKMDELNSKPFQSNKFYGDGIKIKSKLSKPDKIIDKKKAGMDDDLASEDDRMANDVDNLTLDQTSKLTEVDKWLNKNVQYEENLYTDEKNEKKLDLGTNSSSKLPNPKTLKRTKKCGECSSCEAEDCGDCRSCEINHQFSDSLILGKVPCLTNNCEFPVKLTGDMDAVSLMSLQDDSSNGTVCPVKIVNGVLYDFRCFFCKKLPRVGSVNRSELMRHYSTIHYAKELKEDYELFMVDGHCLLCDIKTSSTSISSHIGQKHNEVVNYLPPEAVALCPKLIQKEQKGGRHPRAAAAVSSQTGLAEVLDWPQVPKGFDPSSKDRNWKGNTSSDSSEEIEIEDIEIVNGWIIEHVTNSDEELPLGNDPTLDYSGVGGRCSVCQREFDEVTDAVLHLHDDHDIKGGSSYLMKDCQNFIKSGFIQVSKVQNEILPSTIHNKVDENVTPSLNSDGYLDFEAKRYVAKKATSRKSRSSSTLLKEQLTRWNSQHSSSNDEETSAQCDEVGMALLPATIHDKADENSKPSRNVARKSTSQKSWPSSTLLKEQIFRGNSQHSSSNDDETPAHCDEIEMEFLPATIHDKDDEKSTPSRNVARKSTGQKSWSSTSPMKEPITRGNFQHGSSNDVETSAYCDETEMELVPATIHDKDDENTTASRNVARKSTGQKSWSSTTMKEHITLGNFQHDLFK